MEEKTNISQSVIIFNILISYLQLNSSEDRIANISKIEIHDPYNVEPNLSAAVRIGHLFICVPRMCAISSNTDLWYYRCSLLAPYILYMWDFLVLSWIQPFFGYTGRIKRFEIKLDLAFNSVKPKDWYFVLD